MVQHEDDHSGGQESGGRASGGDGPGGRRPGGPLSGGQPSRGGPSGYEPPGGEQSHEPGGVPARMAQLISGGYLLTVNPLDGSEIEPCPPGRRPGAPGKRPPKDRPRASRPPTSRSGHSLSGAAAGATPLLERDEERERLSRLLARGRSVRLTAARGSGRSVLLDAVAEDTATLAPDGVVRLSGYHRTADAVLRDLFAAVYDAPHIRPDQGQLLESLASVGAVVLLDDIEFGGTALDELLAATPECAYLITATPDTDAPSPDAGLEEVFLSGLSRAGCTELLEHALRRRLTEEEADWAGDLWFTTEGQPLGCVQAGALLRQRDKGAAAVPPGLPGTGTRGGAEGIVARLAGSLSEPGREALLFALALGGELPHPAHLPALVGDTHADDALAELIGSGLVTTVGGHYRLAAGAAAELVAAGHEDTGGARVQAAAQHYGWWVGHSKVTPEQVGAEADAVLAAVRGAQRGGRPSAAVLLARAAAPALAAALSWEAWERALRSGQEAARQAGEVAEEAYFHHELGVLALCTGNPERARAELETSIGMRGVLADRRGTVAGRRALALVTDRLSAEPGGAAAASTAVLPGGGLPGSAAAAPSAASSGSAGPSASSADSAPGRGGTTPGVGPRAASGAPGAPRSSEAETGVLPAVTGRGAVGAGSGLSSDTPAGRAPGAPGAGPFPTPARPRAALPPGADPATSVVPAVGSPGKGGPPGGDDTTVISASGPAARHRLGRSARRNLMAAGAGAALAVVLGTVVAVSSVSDSEEQPADTVKPDRTSSQPDSDTESPSDSPSADEDTPSPTESVSEEPTPSPTSEAPTPSETSSSASPSDDESSPDDDESSPTSGGSSSGSSGNSGSGSGGSGSGGSGSGGSGSGGSGNGGSGNGGSGNGGSGNGGADDGGADEGGADNGGADDGGADNGGADEGGADNGGADDGGADNGTAEGPGSPTTAGSPSTSGSSSTESTSVPSPSPSA